MNATPKTTDLPKGSQPLTTCLPARVGVAIEKAGSLSEGRKQKATPMKKLNSITVAELIELLQDQDPEAAVCFSSDYGDHCHTQQVLTLRGEAEMQKVYESAYSDSGFAVVKDDEDDDGTEEQQVVLVIS